MAREYACDMCGGTFVQGWSDEEAMAECAENFGANVRKEECAIICEDCYQKFIQAAAEQARSAMKESL